MKTRDLILSLSKDEAKISWFFAILLESINCCTPYPWGILEALAARGQDFPRGVLVWRLAIDYTIRRTLS